MHHSSPGRPLARAYSSGLSVPVSDVVVIHQDHTAISRFAAAELKAGEHIAGRYRILGLLGVGGMGVVYHAHDEQLQVDVALKLLRPELASRPEAFERFRQELLIARQVSSPHVVRIHDLVADEGRWLISMDYVPGQSLERLLDGRRHLPQDEAIAITRQIALGLSAAHASDIVHRDLKPANILLRDDGRACISDFGVARTVGSMRVTGTGLMVGTPDYLSPEQARGEDVNQRSDLYALGLILFEMLDGQLPFAGATAAESLAQRQFRRPSGLRKRHPEIAPWVERLAMRLLDPNPLRRLRDADEVVRAIDTQSVGRARPRWPALALAASLVAAIAGGAWWWQSRGMQVSVTPAANLAAEMPLDLIVLPLQADAADADLARAYTVLINTSLLSGQLATADRRRTQDALARLGYDADSAAQHTDRVLAELGGKRALGGRLSREGNRLSVALYLTSNGNPSLKAEAGTAEVSLEALPPAVRGALAQLGISPAQGELGTVWSTSEAALRHFGRGLAARSDHDALAAFRAAANADPRFIAAWWHALQRARRLLPDAALSAMAAQARESLRGVRGRDAERVLGLIALIEGNPKLAVERLAPLAAADAHDHHTRLIHGESLEATGDRNAAEREYASLTSKDPKNAYAWLQRGLNAIRAGESQRAVDDYLLRARILFERLGDQQGLADTLNALGAGLDMLGQTEPSIKYYTQAAELRETSGNLRGAASSRLNVAWSHAIAGDHAAAEVDLSRARDFAKTSNDPALLADIANDAGLIAEERGDFRAALPHFREALKLREGQGDAIPVAEAALNLGFALMHTGEFDDALSHLQQAERTYAAAEDRAGMARSLQLLASIDTARGDFAAAEARLHRALRLVEEVNLADERAVMYVSFAELERLRGNHDAALSQAQRALALFQQNQHARGSSEAQLQIVAAHIARGGIDEAQKALVSIPEDAGGNREHAAALRFYRGRIALARGEHADALASADAAIAGGSAAGSMPVELHARLLRAQALAAVGRSAEARKELAAFDRLLLAYPAQTLRRERERVAQTLRGQDAGGGVAVAPTNASTKDRQ
jgi:eukaryotic-like serine/threonine-protein kinase